MSLDTITLYSIVTATAVLGAFLLALLGRRAIGLPGALTWAGGLGLLAVYFLLALLHRQLPPFVGLALANGIGVAGIGVMHRGACQICERPFPLWLHGTATIIVVGVIGLWLSDVTGDFVARVALVGLVTAVQCGLIVATMAAPAPDAAVDELKGRRVVMAVFGAVAVLQLVRVVAHTPIVGIPETGLLSPSALSQIAAMGFLAWCVAMPVVVVYIHEVRARQSLSTAVVDLTRALSEVKTLRDLLPICASCRRIRDDQQQWSSLELYLKTHAGVQMTHGLCPDCIAHLYPEFTPSSRESGAGPSGA